MQLPKNLKRFSQHFAQFVQSRSTFKHFEKKMTFIANTFEKLTTVEDMVRRMFGEPRFTAPFEGEHVKASRTLIKSACQIFYRIFCSL